MSPRQLIRLYDVRAPQQPNTDSLTQQQVRSQSSSAEDMEAYTEVIRSQIRITNASQGWTQPPYPETGTGGATNDNGYPSRVGQEVWGEALGGLQDGVNTAYSLSHYAVPQTCRIFYNGLRLNVGQSEDYVMAESVPGAGFDTVMLTGAVPLRSRDKIWADYIRSA